MADQTVDFLLPSDHGLSLTTGTRFTIRVRPGLRAFRAELEDVLFHFNSAVMLPEAPRPAEPDTLPPRQPFTGLDAIAAALAHAVLHPERKLLVTGHADTVGSDSDNLALSNLRSRNVLALLAGDKPDWVKTADSKHKTEDHQQILKWAAVQRQWPTDPGAIDGQDGPKTQEALK